MVNVTKNSPSRDYSHPDDQTTQTTETPGFKPFTMNDIIVMRVAVGISSLLTFDSMDRTLKTVTIHWKAVEQYFTVVLFAFEKLLVLD